MLEPDPTRERLLCAAMETFATHGYQGSSTREICQAANLGNASIHYHFGDKQTIYRELFTRLLDDFEKRMRGAGIESLQGRDALYAYYMTLMRPLAEDAKVANQVYLHLREEFQPTGLVDDLQPRSLVLQFELLGDLLQRELGVRKLDATLHRLVLGIHGLALIYIVKGRTIAQELPGQMDGPNWLERLSTHLSYLGWGMVEHERRRRAATSRKKRLQPA